jgi:Restriction endonuclease
MRKPAGRAYQELVAQVVKAFDPKAHVSVGQWVEGPDGRLDMDVSIRGTVDGKPLFSVIECKDFTLSSTGKVGRPLIDALDSKRHDLGVDLAFICSNSGFTENALSKARRKGIGAISVLAHGDDRVKVKIERESYFRRIRLDPIEFTYHGKEISVYKDLHSNELRYGGAPVDAWLQMRASLFALAKPEITDRISMTFALKTPNKFYLRGKTISLDKLEIKFTPQTQWFSQIHQLDAAAGMYDYIRGKVKMVSGDNKYIVSGLDLEKGTPLSSAPVIEVRNPLSGEVEMHLALVQGLSTEEGATMPKLEEIVVPEDLEPIMPSWI